jgi:SAM-dependent methyltransferase
VSVREVCPICDTRAPAAFLQRDDVPVHQNLLFDNPDAARAIARGTLALTACPTCGFVYNRAFDASLLAYGDRYENAQDCSPAFAAHVRLLADEIARAAPEDARIVEIGCGKGSFLRALVDAVPGARATGFDPSYTGDESERDGRLRFERRFFDGSADTGPVDVVICRHVIEHVADPAALLGALRRTLDDSPGARLYFETPCVEWILRNRVIWDVFYEHCSYFSAGSLAFAFERAGFIVASVRRVFAGQYLWLEAVPAASHRAYAPSPGGFPELAQAFAQDYEPLVDRWRQTIQTAAAQGKVAVWGAGAKGVTFANVVDPDAALLDCAIDLNPNKQGRFVPGTGHPIVEPSVAALRGVRSALLMNPNYAHENAALLAASGLPIDLVA